jgi:hypothetical protein
VLSPLDYVDFGLATSQVLTSAEARMVDVYDTKLVTAIYMVADFQPYYAAEATHDKDD